MSPANRLPPRRGLDGDRVTEARADDIARRSLIAKIRQAVDDGTEIATIDTSEREALAELCTDRLVEVIRHAKTEAGVEGRLRVTERGVEVIFGGPRG